MESTFSYYVRGLSWEFISFCKWRLQALGITQGLLYYLLYIGKHPGVAPGDLATGLSSDSGQTTRSVEKLIQLGYVVKTRNGQDKRTYSLNLTGVGSSVFDKARLMFADWDNEILSVLTAAERQQLMGLIDKVSHDALHRQQDSAKHRMSVGSEQAIRNEGYFSLLPQEDL